MLCLWGDLVFLPPLKSEGAKLSANDRNIDTLASNLTDSLLATHLGHHEVDQDEVGIRFLNASDGGLSVSGAHNVKALTLKHKVYDIEGGNVVINYEYFVAHE